MKKPKVCDQSYHASFDKSILINPPHDQFSQSILSKQYQNLKKKKCRSDVWKIRISQYLFVHPFASVNWFPGLSPGAIRFDIRSPNRSRRRIARRGDPSGLPAEIRSGRAIDLRAAARSILPVSGKSCGWSRRTMFGAIPGCRSQPAIRWKIRGKRLDGMNGRRRFKNEWRGRPTASTHILYPRQSDVTGAFLIS